MAAIIQGWDQAGITAGAVPSRVIVFSIIRTLANQQVWNQVMGRGRIDVRQLAGIEICEWGG